MDIDSYIDELRPLIAFESVSAKVSQKKVMVQTAQWLKRYFERNSFKCKLYEFSNINPLVLAEYKVNSTAKTVLLYGHYDVATTDNQTGWSSNPFKITKRDNHLYSRGIADDKGQFFIHLQAISNLIKENRLNVNVKVMLEGNEEVDNPNLKKFIREYKNALAADMVLISDGPGIGHLPTIEASLRAGFDISLVYKTTDLPLHNGIYGGGVPNAANEIVLLTSKILGKDNQVLIPGFYNDVDEISPSQVEACQRLVPDEKQFMKSLGLKSLVKKPGISFYAQTGLLPTIQISGITSGHVSGGYGTTVPHQAIVKFNIRLVKSQNPEKVRKLLEEYINNNTPSYIDYELDYTNSGVPVKVDVTKPVYVKIQKLIQGVYGDPSFVRYVGGSIPVVTDFQQILDSELLVLSLANEDSNEHGPNENLSIEVILKAYNFSYSFFSSVNLWS